MTQRTPEFRDRDEAGRRLAPQLQHVAADEPIILAIPEGGVPVALAIARVLGAPVDTIVLDSGASTRHRLEAQARMRSRSSADSLFDASGGAHRVAQSHVGEDIADITERMSRHDELPAVDGRAVILVDDGLSADTTVHDALRTIRYAGARRVVLATPFLTRSSADLHDSEVDVLIAVQVVDEYGAATDFYEDATPPDAVAVRALLEAWRRDLRSVAVT